MANLVNKRFAQIKNKILGIAYDLSVASVTAPRMRALNKQYRKKAGVTDILAFPLSKRSGEMVLHLPTVRVKAKQFHYTYEQYLVFLFIHGCLHLKGLDHGRAMERAEDRWCRAFSLPLPTRR